jgi:N-acetylneuraminate synthase
MVNKGNQIFKNLFVLEMANNHWGDRRRGLKIISEFGAIVRYNSVRAAIKLQIRDVDSFIHPDYKCNSELRYINKTKATKLEFGDYAALVDAIKEVSCLPMATAFDEKSVELCQKLELPLLKVASSDLNDWPLLEKIASTRLPVVLSTGGGAEKDIDDVVLFFERRDIPLAINHCVSLYPSENFQLELNQIDYLRARYPKHVIGFSSHEYRDWRASMFISYAKGARTWERHIDMPYDDGQTMSAYCSSSGQIDEWFKAWHLAKEMCGGSGAERRVCPAEEIAYLDALVRGVYARRDLEPGYIFSSRTFARDFYLAIPLHKGQLSCREVMNGARLTGKLKVDEALNVDCIDGPCSRDRNIKTRILRRGL